MERDSELSAKKSSRRDWKKETEKKINRMNSVEQKVSDVIQEGEDIDEELERVKEELEKGRRELQVKEAGKFTYADMLEVMSKMAAPACPTCSREFGKKHEADELREELQEKIDAIPGKVKALENRVKQKTGQLERLQQVRPDVAALILVRKEVDEGKTKIAALERDIKKLNGELEEEMIKINETQADMLKFKGVSDDVQMIDVLVRELRNLEDDRQEINAKAPDVIEGRELVNVRREEQESSSSTRIPLTVWLSSGALSSSRLLLQGLCRALATWAAELARRLIPLLRTWPLLRLPLLQEPLLQEPLLRQELELLLPLNLLS